eukprot:3417561-Prymnesium_polylepis.2
MSACCKRWIELLASTAAGNARGRLTSGAAAHPLPSMKPDTPVEPASVRTRRVAKSTARMAWLPVSATYRMPTYGSTARPDGSLSCACVPT